MKPNERRTFAPLALGLALALQASVVAPSCSSTQARAEHVEIHEAAVAALIIAQLSVVLVEDLAKTWRRSLRAPMNVDVVTADGVAKAIVDARAALVAAEHEVDRGGFALGRVVTVSDLMADASGDLASLGAKVPAELVRALAFLDTYVGVRK